MEELLQSFEYERLSAETKSNELGLKSSGKEPKRLTSVCTDFSKALHELAFQYAESLNEDVSSEQKIDVDVDTDAALAGVAKSAPDVNDSVASWLYNLASTIPSPLDTLSLSSGVLSACQRGDDMSIQSALFELLGESERSMEVLFEIMPRAAEISVQVTEEHLRMIHEGNSSSITNASANVPVVQAMDPEIEHMNFLRQQVMETADYASLLKAQAEGYSMGSGPSAATHTVKRSSDKAANKRLKQAVKAAAAALTAAKEAGAIVDDDDLDGRGYDAYAMASEAADQFNPSLHHMDQDEFRNFQSNLLPEGTKEYHQEKGLPKGTEREYFDGYEMVTIPAAVKDPEKLHKRIVIKDVMTKDEQKAFAGTQSLNPMQSAVFEGAFHTSDNLLICAPTGAGKTNVAMLTVVAHLRDKGIIKNENDPYAAYQHIGEDQTVSQVGRKIVYIAPMKALAQEVVEKFSSKLKSLGVIVKELTGDMQLTKAEAERADILVTTPEKWDVVTRKGGDGSLGQTCGLLIIDEVHLLADERGAVIESVVARLHRFVESSQKQVRIVGLSATLPNYKDVATFLRVDHQRGLYYFGPEHRPVPLQQHFVGITETKNRFKREKKMNEVCYNIVSDSLRRGYQVMVFVHSRKGTGETIEELTEIANKRNELERYFITQGSDENGDAHSRYADRAQKSRNREVSKHFNNGMGIHHAGMLRGDRKLSEEMFNAGAIKVLCCTATLAWGINLPAHTVVIKGTEVYNSEKGGNMDLSILDVRQIFGRAGRPQFDNFGEATLITSHDGLARYLDKLVKEVPIESTFIKQLADHLNAEIVGGTVTNITEAAEWLMYTYLHVRMTKNPIAYGINASESESDPMLRGRSLELVKDAAKLLDSYLMIRFHSDSGNLAVTDLGRVASHYYIRAESVSRFNEMLQRKTSPSDADLLDVICNAQEFENVKVRAEELEEMDKLAKNDCPLEVNTPVEEFQGKSCVLMQAFISCSRVKSFTLISDSNYIASNAGRVARALFEMVLKRGAAGAALKLLRIAKTVDKRIWWFQTPMRQFEGELPQNVYKALESRSDTTKTGFDGFESALALLEMQPGEVGQFCHWSKGGSKVQRFVRFLPNISIQCNVQPISRSILRFQVTLTPDFSWSPRWHGGTQGFWMWVEDSGNNRIYHQEYVLFNRRTHPDAMNLELTVPAFDPLPSQYFVRVVSDSWVGSETLLPVTLDEIMMPEQEMPYTDLMDLTPLPVTALQNKKFEQLYTKFTTFNPIQTQLFHTLYHTDSPVLLGAPTGSGKTIVAELCLLKMKRDNPKAKCVYIAPLKSLARERLKEWKKRLGDAPLKWKVIELSGDTHHDRRTLQTADVLVCTPEKWDLVSRGWRGVATVGDNDKAYARDFVKDVRLLVIDEIHLLGEERGAVLEAIVSRTRFISRLLKAEGKSGVGKDKSDYDVTRIVGLSTAIANPYDLADWIGIKVDGTAQDSKVGLYNFRPSVRPIPMEIHIAGFAGRHYCPRMATMNKPCYAAIKEHSPTKPVIIFVASRRQTRLTALDLINYAAGDENPGAFLGCSDQYIESVASTLSDASLRHTITFGIGLHHAGLPSKDREVVETMFLNGDIQILVATATLAWGVNLPAHLVIVKGTEFFDGKESRYVDYPVTDVLQMMGRAGRPQFDTQGVACIMVEEGKKNFYKRFLYDPFPVESCLGPRLIDTLNAEIAVGTVSSVEDCIGYLDWTFFARRARMNPSYYNAKSSNDDDVADFLHQTVLSSLEKLKENRCISIGESGLSVRPTHLGVAACNFYLNPKTPLVMERGSQGVRRLIKSGREVTVTSELPNQHSFKTLSFPDHLEESAVALILYSLSQTPEFSELPVRHNEEHLNSDLNTLLPWGPVPPIYNGNGPLQISDYDEDVMADPHTKCYLLLQAFIVKAKLPISDYIGDSRSVLDQVPRLLAAAESIAAHDMMTEYSFDLFCMFSRTTQVINTRSMPGHNPFLQFASVPKNKVERMKKLNKTLRDVLGMTKKEMSSLGLSNKALSEINRVPCFTIENTNVRFTTNKSTGKSEGTIKFDLLVNISNGDRNISKRAKSDLSFVFALGTQQQSFLLAHTSAMVSTNGRKQSPITRSVQMKFDWSMANSCGGVNAGLIRLRVMNTNVRGMDIECQVPLK